MGRRKLRNKGTVLGKEFSITGDIKGNGSIVVGGQVTGDADIEGLIELAPDAVWEGNIRTDDAIIGGTLRGDIFARGKLEITASAKIFGNVSGVSASIAPGAMVSGAMRIHDDEAVNKIAGQYSEDVAPEKSEKITAS